VYAEHQERQLIAGKCLHKQVWDRLKIVENFALVPTRRVENARFGRAAAGIIAPQPGSFLLPRGAWEQE